MSGTSFLFTFFIIGVIILVIEISQYIAQKLDIPQVVGELIAGITLGPSLLKVLDFNASEGTLFHNLGFANVSEISIASEAILFLSEIAALLLLFEVGLKIDINLLRKVGREAFGTAIGGTLIPFGLGFGFAFLFSSLFTVPGMPILNIALFLGTALSATSIGISLRVLIELDRLGTKSTRILIGAAIIDDILALLIFALVSKLVSSEQTTEPFYLVLIQIALFFAIAVIFALIFNKYIKKHLIGNSDKYRTLTISLIILFGIAWLAGTLQLSPIIGAFFAGIIIGRDEVLRDDVDELFKPLVKWLVPFFFIAVGLRIDLKALTSFTTIVVAVFLSFIAIISKVLGSGLGASINGQNKMDSLEIGFGMSPRGEVILLIATAALELGVFNDTLFAMIIMTVTLSALLSPFALKFLLRKQVAPEESIF